jgi:predicted enzyme related to lactoylglutathione lyase
MSNQIVHFEFAGPDEMPLHQFYQGLFDWPVKAMGPGYALVETPDGSPNGALVHTERAQVVIGVGVEDLTAALRKAVELGGTVVMPPTDNGYVNKAQVADPAGNLVSLIQIAKLQ